MTHEKYTLPLHRVLSYFLGKLMYNTYVYTTKETWNVYATKSKSIHHPSIVYVLLSSAGVAFHIVYCMGKLMYNTYAYTTKETWNVYETKSKSTHHPSIVYVMLSSACVAFHIVWVNSCKIHIGITTKETWNVYGSKEKVHTIPPS